MFDAVRLYPHPPLQEHVALAELEEREAERKQEIAKRVAASQQVWRQQGGQHQAFS